MIRSVSRLWLALAVLLALGGGSHLPIASILVRAAGSTDSADPSAKGPVIGELMAETGFYQSMTLSSDVEQPLYHTRSKYQDISIVKTEYYGKVLILDGVVQLTERDADSYNEMMAHIAMMAVTEPKRVLVVGGGDGYVLSEVSFDHASHTNWSRVMSFLVSSKQNPGFVLDSGRRSGTIGLVSLREIA